MKLLRYGQVGQEKPGLMDSQGKIRDLSQHIDEINGATISPENLTKLKGIDTNSLPVVDGNPRLAEPVSQVGKFICVGLNYADHAAETGVSVPSEPVLFMKATSSIMGPNDDVVLPPGSEKSDWEVELGVIIGKETKYVSEADAMEHVAGFCVINDLSEREYQIERQGQWCKGKGCDTFGPFGPYLVTTDEVDDVDNLSMWLDVNGQRMQTGNTKTMVYKVPFLIHYISQFMSLQPGDIISTGTPPGVGLGMTPPLYLKEGDTMKLSIENLGEQQQRVVRFTS